MVGNGVEKVSAAADRDAGSAFREGTARILELYL